MNSILSVCHAGRRNTKRKAREVAIMAALVDKRGGDCEKKPSNNVKEFYTDKKENQIFLIYKEIRIGAVAKSYMTNGLLILNYLRISSYIRKPFLIYDFATAPL